MNAVAVSPRRIMPLIVLEASTLLSGVANGITMIAFPWLVLEITGSPAAAGAMGAITALPLAVSFLFSGVIVDLVGRRRVAIVSDLLSMTSAALVPIFSLAFGLSFGVLAALAILGATFDPAGISARETMLPEIAHATGWSRSRVNGVHEMVWGVAFLIGPGVGGLSLGLLGAAPTYWLSAAMFLASAAVMLSLRVAGVGKPVAHHLPAGVWKGTWEGIRYVWQDRPLRAMALLSMVVVGVWLPVEGVILPVHFNGLDQPQQLGFTIMSMAIGGVLGALVYSAWGERLSQRAIFGGAIALAGVAVVGMAVFPPQLVMLLAAFASGFFYGPVGPVMNLAMQNRSPYRLRGRVVSLLTSAAYVAGPIGYVLVGPSVAAIGVQQVFLGIAVAVIVVGIVALLVPSLAQMTEPVAESQDQPVT